ncbi:MAG: hypothetical protein ACLFR0_06615 [Alphaproteobacteria bacterium]
MQNSPAIPKNSILGALELALFMPKGIQRFNTDIKTALNSFLVPLAIMPLNFLALYYSHPHQKEIAHLPFAETAGMFLVKGLFGFVLNVSVLYAFARGFNKTEHFWLVITAGHWSLILPTLLFTPLIFSLGLGWHSWEEIYNINIVFALYSYGLAAFILTYGFRIPWEMGGALAIVFMAINETGFDVLYWLASP